MGRVRPNVEDIHDVIDPRCRMLDIGNLQRVVPILRFERGDEEIRIFSVD